MLARVRGGGGGGGGGSPATMEFGDVFQASAVPDITGFRGVGEHFSMQSHRDKLVSTAVHASFCVNLFSATMKRTRELTQPAPRFPAWGVPCHFFLLQIGS